GAVAVADEPHALGGAGEVGSGIEAADTRFGQREVDEREHRRADPRQVAIGPPRLEARLPAHHLAVDAPAERRRRTRAQSGCSAGSMSSDPFCCTLLTARVTGCNA